MKPPAHSDLPINGDTIIGNDIWISQNTMDSLVEKSILENRQIVQNMGLIVECIVVGLLQMKMIQMEYAV